MAGLDLAAQSEKLVKRVYGEDTTPLEDQSAPLYSRLKNGDAPAGDGYYFGVEAGQNQEGIAAQNEHEALPVADDIDVVQGRIQAKKVIGKCQMTGLAKYAMPGGEASFGNGVLKYMDRTFKETLVRKEQMIFRNGQGLLARTAAGVSGSTTVTFDTGIKTHLRHRMSLDIWDSALGSKQASGVKITAISTSADSFTIDTSSTVDDNAYIFIKGHYDNYTAPGKEWAGLPLATDDGTDSATYEGIIRSGSGFVDLFKGLEIDASSANLSDDMLQRALEQFIVYGNGTECNMVIMSPAQKRKYLSLSLPSLEYKTGESRDTGHPAKVMWDGKEIHFNRFCGRDEVYLLNDDCFKKYVLSNLKWADEFGGTVIKWNAGYDSGIAYCRSLGNYGTENPRGIIRIHSLATPTL